MNSRERLQCVLAGGIPDHVPVAPDTSNMIPARLTGKPFWDLYLYQDPPIWKAYLDCAKTFGFDSLMDGYVPIRFEELGEMDHLWTEVIVKRTPDRIITQRQRQRVGGWEWADTVTVYFIDNPPSAGIKPESIALPKTPLAWEPVEGRREWPEGEALLAFVKEEMGDHGLVGVFCGTSVLISSEAMIYDYYDQPEKYYKKREHLLEYFMRRFHKLMSLSSTPDFICTGGSGTLIHQTPKMFRELGLPIVKAITALGKQYGIPTHIHSCGPEKELVRICAEETDLTAIDPLEIPPMGDCDLKELKALYGDRLVLKGNLHTTQVMLNGTVPQVIDACKRAIDDGAAGGRFILSTGDQCGRDTPDENLLAMINTAKTYGRY